MVDQSRISWMRKVLLAAAAYNAIWGAAAILFPSLPFQVAGAQVPNYPELWQCIGMFVLVWGVGYACAALDPIRHWPVVLVGLLGKILGPIGFAWSVWNGRLPISFGWTIITNDLIWWIPFGLILAAAYEETLGKKRTSCREVQRMAMRARTRAGQSIEEMSRRQPVMLVFLRHLGCTFCREALSDIAKNRRAIEEAGTKILLVHMGSEEQAAPMLSRYGLFDIDRVSDPRQAIYKAFGLGRGGFWSLFGPRMWWRGFQAGVLARHGVGTLIGDGFQMPGVFIVFHGEVIRSYVHQDAADRPDYLSLADATRGPREESIA
jgi:hypothetical protein